MKQKYKSIRLFKSDILESFSHIHPATPFVVWVPIILYLLYCAVFVNAVSASIMIAMFAGGIFFWTFAEYSIHRFVFHFPAKSDFAKYIVFLTHGIHHDDPSDPTRLVLPPALSLPLSVPFYFLFKAVFGPTQYHTFFAGFLSGYLTYDFIHYATHHFQMKSALGKKLKEYHMKHHFVDHDAKWGVSSPMWDHVFNTVLLKPKKREQTPQNITGKNN